MGYEIDFLPVGDGEKSGDAIALRYGNLHGRRDEQVVIVIDGGYADDGQALIDHLAEHYNTDVVDIVLSTHPDQDHVAGLEVLVESITVRELWMHLPWAHSQPLELSRSARFTSTKLSDKIKKSLQDVSDLEAIARARNVTIQEPFVGLSTPDGVFSIWGPTVEYYEELLADIASGESHLEGLMRSLLAKAADTAARLVPESLHIETLTDLGKTSPQNNSSAIALLQIDSRLSLFTGDAGMPALGLALDRLEAARFSPGALNFVQVPHHGSRRNVGPTVLNRLLGPKGTVSKVGSAFVSAAPDGSPKHPAKKVTNAFLRRGYPVHATQGGTKRHFWQAPSELAGVPPQLSHFMKLLRTTRVEVEMPIDLKDTFDTYNRRARLYPAFLAASPVAIFVVLLWKNSPLAAVGSVLVSVGGLFFLANVVRTRGRRLETRLTAQWDGQPTTHLLRHRDSENPIQLERWHAKLAKVTGVRMPSQGEESADPTAADNSYVTATRALIAQVRDETKSFPLVHEENTQYGFRRNLLALKPIGVAIALACLVADIVTGLVQHVSLPLIITAVIQLLILLVWLTIVNGKWVRDAGDAYAQRLFETLEKLDTAPKEA